MPTLHLTQASLELEDKNPAHAAQDATAAFARKPHAVGFTEAQHARPQLARAATKAGYQLWLPAGSDVGIAVRGDLTVLARTDDEPVPHRHLVSVTFELDGVKVAFTETHLHTTRVSLAVRARQTAALEAKVAADAAAGLAAFWAADLNRNLRPHSSFRSQLTGHGLLPVQVERNEWAGTHRAAVIDTVGRAVGAAAAATAVTVHPARSDHDQVDATYDLAAVRRPKEKKTMTETRGVDYSDARPAPALLVAAGYVGAGRYIALGTSDKLLSPAEAHTLRRHGIKLWLVAESTANRALAGHAAGVADAQAALKAANALGAPAHTPIFAAVDFDASWAQVADYLAGWASVLGARAGDYGPWDVIEHSPLPWHWQAGASTSWSHGRNARLHPKAHLYQRLKPQGKLPAGCDENVVCRPIHCWGGVLAPPGAAPADRKPAKRPAAKKQPNVDAAVAATQTALHNAKKPGRKKWLRSLLALFRKGHA